MVHSCRRTVGVQLDFPHGFPQTSLLRLMLAAHPQALVAASPGPICQKAMQSGTGNYLANLVLFPGGLDGWLGGRPSGCITCLWQGWIVARVAHLLCPQHLRCFRYLSLTHTPFCRRQCSRPAGVCGLPAAQLPGGADPAGGQGWSAGGGQRHAARLQPA